MDLKIESKRTDDGVAVITVAGELDLYTAPRLTANLPAALAVDVRDIVGGTSGGTIIDRLALGMFIVGCNRIKSQGGRAG